MRRSGSRAGGGGADVPQVGVHVPMSGTEDRYSRADRATLPAREGLEVAGRFELPNNGFASPRRTSGQGNPGKYKTAWRPQNGFQGLIYWYRSWGLTRPPRPSMPFRIVQGSYNLLPCLARSWRAWGRQPEIEGRDHSSRQRRSLQPPGKPPRLRCRSTGLSRSPWRVHLLGSPPVDLLS